MVRRSGLIYSVAGLLALCTAFASPRLDARDIWTVNIDEGPAPPPAQRPPFSRGARHDLSLLKYQIPGLAGGYLGAIIILWLLLLTIGRRLRREAQSARSSLAMEMVKPLKRTLDPSPVSPSSSHNFWRWGSRSQKATNSPEQPSIYSFDDKVIEHDRMQREEEMERLYAAVMSKDAKSPKPIPIPVAGDYEAPAIRSPMHVRRPSSSSKSFSQPQPPHVREATYNPDLPSTQTRPPVPEAISRVQPPSVADMAYKSPTRTTNMTFPAQQQQPQPTQIASPSRQDFPANQANPRTQTPPQVLGRQGSVGSTKSKSGRASVRNLQISPPIPLPAYSVFRGQESGLNASEPLSPHYIPSNPPRPPSPPSQSRPHTPFEEEFSEDDGNVLVNQRHENNNKDEDQAEGDKDFMDSIIHAYGGEDVDNDAQPAPPRTPQPAAPRLSIRTLQPSTKPSPSSLNPRQPSRSPAQAGTTNNPLPFRAFHPPPPASPTQPTPPYQSVSPGPTKTTFLSPRRDRFLPGGMNAIGPGGAPNTAALLSAGLATPYSPYMPFSPMTPVTPRLPSQRERRAREREAGRAVATAEDRVQDEAEMWGDAWN